MIREMLGRCYTRVSNGRISRCFVDPHRSDRALAPGPRKWDSVIVTSSNRQRSQGATRAIEIPLTKRYFKPKLRYVLAFARTFRNDRSDRGAQRLRITMPVKFDICTIRSHA